MSERIVQRPHSRSDLRLVPAALTAWTGSFVGTSGAPTMNNAPGPGMSAGGSVGLVVVLACVALVGLASVVSVVAVAMAAREHPLATSRFALLVTLALVVGTGALIAGHGRVAAQAAGPVVGLAMQRAEVHLRLRLTSDPVPRSLPPGTPHWRTQHVRVTASVIQVADPVTARAPPSPRAPHADQPGSQVSTPVVVLAPSSWQPLRPGDLLSASGRLGLPSRPGPAAAVLIVDDDPVVTGRTPSLLAVGDGPRKALRDSVDGLPSEAGGLLPSLVVGDETLLTDQTRENLRVTGLAHLTAVSGANVAIVLGAVLLAARWAGLRGVALPLVGLLAIGVFVLLARPDPSVVRASAMGVVVVLGLLGSNGSRGGRGIAPLAVAATLLLLADPWLSRSIGFALSCVATAGIVLLARPWAAAAWTWMPRPVAVALAVPLAAQLVCTPLLVGMAGELSLSAVPANVLAAPAVPPATVLGIAAALVGVVWPGAAHLLSALAMLPTGWIVLVAENAADLPGTAVTWTWGVPLALLGSLILIAVTPTMLRSPVATAAVCAGLLAMLLLPGRGWPPPGWVVAACDVGQGDAVVLRTAPRQAIVVDVGPDPEALRTCLDDLDVQSVPVLVITHLHADHVFGLDALGGSRTVDSLIVTVHDEPPEHAAMLASWAEANGVEAIRAKPGQAGRTGDVSWRVLWPQRVITGIGSTPNQASVVVRADVRGLSVLLTGDIEPAAQQALLAMPGVDLDVDVLKVPHHGSSDQHSPFLTATSPAVALVTVGADNSYGHPSEATLRLLRSLGAVVARTDLDGAVALVAGKDRDASDGHPSGDDTVRVVRRGTR